MYKKFELMPLQDGEISGNKESLLCWSAFIPSIILLWGEKENGAPRKENKSQENCPWEPFHIWLNLPCFRWKCGLGVLQLWCNPDDGTLLPATINQRPWFECISASLYFYFSSLHSLFLMNCWPLSFVFIFSSRA